MIRTRLRLLPLSLAVFLGLQAGGSLVRGQQEIGFAEKFALSSDRSAALAQLIPGTDEYFYFHCLHHQNEGEFAKAQAIIEQWRAKFGDTPQVVNMAARQTLLTYNENPQRTLDFLRDRLGLDFNHAPPSKDRAAELPSVLDNGLLTTERMLEQAIAQDRSLSQIETSGLVLLMERQLAPDQLRALLQRVDRADLPKLVERIAEELAMKDSSGFGWAPIHQQLTLTQLDQLLKLRPNLLEQDNFVRAYAARLTPPEGSSLTDKAELRAYLQRLLAWRRRLPASQNSFKALVLGNLLKLDMSEAKYDRALFIEYLGLPRNAFYYDLARFKNAVPPLAELGYVMQPQVTLPVVGDDSQLVQRYLEHFLKDAENVDEFAKFLNREYLERVLAETKILNGIGSAATWYAKLSATDQKALRERVELRFAPQNKHQFSAADDVSLQVELKNVPQLILKIYKINTLNHYRGRAEPINTDIDLDGLVANVEQKIEYTQAAELRHAESIALPDLSGRGVWVVDLLGGGQRCRAVIQKGSLVALERLGDAGHVFQIVDETGEQLKSAHIELGGRTYEPDSNGKIILPFAEQNVTRNLMLVDGDFAAIQLFVHRSETYELQAGFLLDRQTLVAGTQASLAIRTRLNCNGRPISIELLEEPSLTITATDVEGIATSQVVSGLNLDDGDDFVHKFLVPQRLSRLSFQLNGRVYNQNRDERQSVSTSYSMGCNGIQQSDQIADFFLRQTRGGFRLLVLGRNGEPIGRLPVTVTAKVERFASPVGVSLASNEQGIIELGALENVSNISVSAQGVQASQFQLHRFHRNWPAVVHAGVDSKIVLPLGKDASDATRFTLYEVRRGVQHSAQADKLKVVSGAIEISGLAAGDYVLSDYEAGQRISIVVADAKANDTLMAAKHRILQAASLAPIAIRRAVIEGNNLVVEVTGAEESTRIHLLANPMYPEVSRGAQVQLPHQPLTQQFRTPTLSMFVDSLRLDEEYSYILQRQGIAKYPGNMLAQPTLLIKPWEVSTTNNTNQEAAAGDPMSRFAAPAPAAMDMGAMEAQQKIGGTENWKSYDFLATPTALASNVALENGKASIPINMLKGYCNVTVVAVHATASDSRTVVLPEPELLVRDQRLKSAFARDTHLTQTQRVEVLPANEKKLIGDPRTRRVQTYASIGDVYRLYGTLLSNAEWDKFNFIAKWHQLSDAERRSRYNELACHELNFFLYHKDRKFFDAVVRPLIAQKLDKQLVDLWLLGESLASYDQLWRVQRLNTLEKILLAQSIEARKVGTTRWLSDVVSANPLDPQWRSRRFEVALRGMALDAGRMSGADGFVKALNAVEESASFDSRAGGFGGGMGGMGSGGMGGLGGAVANEPSSGPVDALDLADAPTDKRQNRLAEGEAKAELPGRRARGALGLERGLAKPKRAEFFATLDQTREWAETQYYRVRLQGQTAALIPAGPFWREYLEKGGNDPFLPSSLDLPTGSINEALCALAVIDLPLDGTSPEVLIENEQLALNTKSAAIAFVESIESAGQGGNNENILVGQDVYLAQPNTSEDANRPLQGPLLRGIPYRANVVVTNPTNTKRLVQVLTQIPAGALPLASGKVTRNTPIDLAPYSTAQVQYVFYFPAEGEFEHYGSQISSEGKHVIATDSKSHRVLAKPESVDETTWSYIADWGTADQVFAFLKKANLQKIDLDRIAFRMQDKAFFEQVTALLSANNVYVQSLWAYAVRHNAPEQIQQLLQNRPDFVGQLGAVFTCPLVNIDAREQMSYEHLDYKPLVVARIHQLGPKAVILNDGLFVQYQKLLNVIAHQRSINNDQQLAVCYYMLLQNRIREALAWFEKVDAAKLSSKLQYDYFAAYLGFYRGEYDQAAQLATQYAEHPVLMWKDLFAQVGDQVRQRKALQAGQDITSVTSLDGNSNRQQRMLTDGREAKQTEAAAETPTLDLTNQDGTLSIEYRNLADVKINYYLMDIELLFSRNPFVARSGDTIPVIEPNLREQLTLDNAVGSRRLELPTQLRNRNLLVEVTSRGISRSTVVTANSLAVTVVEPFGRVQVLSAQGRSPLEQAYVKVYARHKDGSIKFYKDGYTDLRGQFDYATLSTSGLDTVDRFAILVLHDSQGAVVREAAPPTR
ncbi:MAG: hypothetical protein SFV81_11025 [Pirellulaceae bacterium]|nr:hypothetical protein [Pirellulaceae bacterium]